MKILKIIVGTLFLCGAGSEYASASHELLSYTSPDILIGCFLVVLLCTWLIGSAVSKDKLQIRSFQFVKYFGISFGAFIIIAFLNLVAYKEDPEIITVNGINIDIAEMMNGSKKIIPDEKQRRLFCICTITKLANDNNVVENYSDELKSGKIDQIIIALKSENKISTLNLEECFNSNTTMSWTTILEESLKKDILDNLRKSRYAKTNDLEKFCDCLIKEYKKLSAKELSSEEFANSQEKQNIENDCDLKSRIKLKEIQTQ